MPCGVVRSRSEKETVARATSGSLACCGSAMTATGAIPSDQETHIEQITLRVRGSLRLRCDSIFMVDPLEYRRPIDSDRERTMGYAPPKSPERRPNRPKGDLNFV